MTSERGWIGVDLDGTLAVLEEGVEWDGISIGPPVPAMVQRVKAWLEQGEDVRIVTARVCPDSWRQRHAIRTWCREHLGTGDLRITASKDFYMRELWDDRAVQVRRNRGVPISDELDSALEWVRELRRVRDDPERYLPPRGGVGLEG